MGRLSKLLQCFTALGLAASGILDGKFGHAAYMQRSALYIGFPGQQQQVLQSIVSDLRRGNSGIFLVTSGIRVGKSTIIKQLERSLGLRVSLTGAVDSYDQVFREVGDCVRLSQQPANDVLLTTTEITVLNTEVMRALNDIVATASTSGHRMRIVGEVMSKRYPAWNSEANNAHIAQTLAQFIQPQLLAVYKLDTDIRSLAESMWVMTRTEHASSWSQTAVELGFPPSYADFWESLPDSRDAFVQSLERAMHDHPMGGIEGYEGRDLEKW